MRWTHTELLMYILKVKRRETGQNASFYFIKNILWLGVLCTHFECVLFLCFPVTASNRMVSVFHKKIKLKQNLLFSAIYQMDCREVNCLWIYASKWKLISIYFFGCCIVLETMWPIFFIIISNVILEIDIEIAWNYIFFCYITAKGSRQTDIPMGWERSTGVICFPIWIFTFPYILVYKML